MNKFVVKIYHLKKKSREWSKGAWINFKTYVADFVGKVLKLEFLNPSESLMPFFLLLLLYLAFVTLGPKMIK